MSAGNKKVDWSPKGLTKVASVGEAVEETNALYEAAKKFAQDFSTSKDEEVKCEKCQNAEGDCKCGVEEVAKKNEAIIEVETPENEKLEEASKQKVVEVAEKLEEAVVELKDAVQGVEIAEEKEIEIEVVPEGAVVEEKANEKPLDIPGKKEVEDGGIVVESKPEEVCDCVAKKEDKKEEVKEDKKEEVKEEKKEDKMDKSAATEEEFCKFAKLSSVNKQKLSQYWIALGFPKDYVNLMTKDYEK
jgi:hypothetical protein